MAAPDVTVVSTTSLGEVDRLARLAREPILQVGSRAAIVDADALRWRDRCRGRDFVGLDIEAGDNVDVVADICEPIEALSARLGGRRFGFIVCQHVLEHVRRPWDAARNIAALLAPGGSCYLAVPWVQAYHGFPRDYWRFSAPALFELFDGLRFVDLWWSGSGTGYDAAYRVLVREQNRPTEIPFDIEGDLFLLLFDPKANTAMVTQQGRLPLARGYLPVTFVNAVAVRDA